MSGLAQGVLVSGIRDLLAGIMVSDGDLVFSIMSGILATLTMVEASRERAQRCSSVVTGLCPPGPPGPSGDACAAAPYCGGIDPDPMTDARIGMKGDPFLSSFRGWCLVRSLFN